MKEKKVSKLFPPLAQSSYTSRCIMKDCNNVCIENNTHFFPKGHFDLLYITCKT